MNKRNSLRLLCITFRADKLAKQNNMIFFLSKFSLLCVIVCILKLFCFNFLCATKTQLNNYDTVEKANK